MVTTKEVIEALIVILDTDKAVNKNIDMIQYGINRGWLESQDDIWADILIDRRSASRIIHEFLRIEFNMPNAVKADKYRYLKDLYDCKVCAKHIIFVCELGIMEPKEENRFKLLDKISKEELIKIIDNIKDLLKDK